MVGTKEREAIRVVLVVTFRHVRTQYEELAQGVVQDSGLAVARFEVVRGRHSHGNRGSGKERRQKGKARCDGAQWVERQKRMNGLGSEMPAEENE